MAPKAKAKAVEPEVELPDYSAYRDKPPTDLQTRMADWVLEQFDVVAHDDEGGELELDEASFREGIRLGVAFRMIFQASPENQAVLAENKARREAEEEAPKPKPAAKKRAAAKVEEPEEEAEEGDEEEAEEKPKATRRKAAASTKAAPARPATRRTTRGKKAAAPAAVGSDAPF